MSSTVQKSLRLPKDIAQILATKGNITEYVVEALREKFLRDEQERFRASARRIANGPAEDRDVEFAIAAQSEVIDEG